MTGNSPSPAGGGPNSATRADAATYESPVMASGAGGTQRPVPVGAELGGLAVDVDGVGAVEVDVLVVGRPDVGEHRVVKDWLTCWLLGLGGNGFEATIARWERPEFLRLPQLA